MISSGRIKEMSKIEYSQEELEMLREELVVRLTRKVYDAIKDWCEEGVYSDDVSVESWQVRPYTMVSVMLIFDNLFLSATNFAKANWPDKFDAVFGFDLCLSRCVKKLAEQIIAFRTDHKKPCVPVVKPLARCMSMDITLSEYISEVLAAGGAPTR